MTSMPRRSPRWRTWSDLPPEILDLFLHRLPHPDCSTFGEVCKPWRSVFLARRRISLPLPRLLLSPLYGPIPRCLWTPYQDRLRRLNSPKPHILPDQQIAGSSMGWLVITSYHGLNHRMHLLDPRSNRQIPLPSLCFDRHAFIIQNVHLSSSPTTDGCVVVGVLCLQSNGNYLLVRCTVGDTSWIFFWRESNDHTEWHDSVLHKGELYVLSHNGDLLVCTFNHQTMSLSTRVCIPSIGKSYWFQRLVPSNGELLLVLRHKVRNSMIPVLSVFRSASTDETSGGWVRVESLGDRVLLIGEHGAESVCTKDLMGCTYEPNCIYHQACSYRLEKYCMAGGGNQRFSIPDCPSYLCPGLEWAVAKDW